MMIRFSLLALSALFLAGCGPQRGGSQNDRSQPHAVTEDTVVPADSSAATETTAEAFAAFWVPFKAAVLADDRQQVAELVAFPFEDHYNDIYDPSQSLTCASAEQFVEHYDDIIDKHTIAAVAADRFRGHDAQHGEFGDIIGPDDFLLMTHNPERPKDLVFHRGKEGFRLVAIQYYE